MYLVEKIDNDGKINKSFTLDLKGMSLLLSMATPNKCSFKITKLT
jgi:hypothetical protein